VGVLLEKSLLKLEYSEGKDDNSNDEMTCCVVNYRVTG